jgi:hypothetical protein
MERKALRILRTIYMELPCKGCAGSVASEAICSSISGIAFRPFLDGLFPAEGRCGKIVCEIPCRLTKLLDLPWRWPSGSQAVGQPCCKCLPIRHLKAD